MNALMTGTMLAALLALDPNPSMGPAEVVRTVVEALRISNTPAPNTGIFTAYRFASPANHRITGPYGNFLRAVKHPDNRPLFDAVEEEFGHLRMIGDAADEVVRVRTAGGQVAAFRFSLSRQGDGACRGCWMVDAVSREPAGR